MSGGCVRALDAFLSRDRAQVSQKAGERSSRGGDTILTENHDNTPRPRHLDLIELDDQWITTPVCHRTIHIFRPHAERCICGVVGREAQKAGERSIQR